MIEVVFFDAGETLVHPHPSFSELFARIATQHGVPIEPRAVRDVQERLAPYLIDRNEDDGPRYSSLSAEQSKTFWTHLYKRFLEELGVEDDELANKLYATFSHSASYRLFDDALPALRELQQIGYRLGLISNFERWLEEMLVELEVGHLFDVTVISGIEGVEKPDPRIYEIAIERASVDPQRAVHIGDSPLLDVAPAASIGMRTVLLDRTGRNMDEPGPRVTSLQELPPILSNL